MFAPSYTSIAASEAGQGGLTPFPQVGQVKAIRQKVKEGKSFSGRQLALPGFQICQASPPGRHKSPPLYYKATPPGWQVSELPILPFFSRTPPSSPRIISGILGSDWSKTRKWGRAVAPLPQWQYWGSGKMAASRRSQHHHHHHQQQLQPAPGASVPPPPPPPPLSPGLAPGPTPASPTAGGLAPFASPRHGLALPEGDGSRDPPDRPRSPDPVDGAVCTVAATAAVPAASAAVGVAPSPAGGGGNNSASSTSSPTSSSSSSPSSPGSSLAESPEAAGVGSAATLGPGAAGLGPGVPAVSGALRELLEACRNGDVSRVKRLVDATNVNAKDMAGRKSSPLHFAAGGKLWNCAPRVWEWREGDRTRKRKKKKEFQVVAGQVGAWLVVLLPLTPRPEVRAWVGGGVEEGMCESTSWRLQRCGTSTFANSV